MKKWVFILLTLVFCLHYSSAQPHCGFDSLLQINMNKEDVYRFDWTIQKHLTESVGKLRGATIFIPVVVHIVRHVTDEIVSDEAVYSQIDALNRDFNAHNTDINKVATAFKKHIALEGIRFCLVHKDTNGKATNGIIRRTTDVRYIGLKDSLFDTKLGGSTAWNPDKYLNIWVANTGEYITGMGSYPNSVPNYKSGVIVHPRYFGKNTTSKFGLGRVAVHEIGHYFGLYHTWGKTADAICETDDDVADTPPQLSAYSGCPIYPQYSCGQSSLFMNFMDYVDDPCMLMFTKGQMQRMLTTIDIYRKGLLNSNAICAKDKDKDIDLGVFPNPTSDKISIHWKIGANTEGGTIQVFNINGQSVIYRNIEAEKDDFILDLPDLPSGFYFLSTEIFGKGIFLQKIVLTK